MQTFTCEICGETYIKGISDIEALEQYMREHPKSFAEGHDVGYVCVACLIEVKLWAIENEVDL
jgi:hypothetical protein